MHLVNDAMELRNRTHPQFSLFDFVEVVTQHKALLYWPHNSGHCGSSNTVKHTLGAEPLTPADLMTHVMV